MPPSPVSPSFAPLPKLAAGDRVAVVSPSWAAPHVFPAVHETALRRLRDEFGLQPVEYPTTRMAGAAPQARAADLTSAFTDPTIRAVMATIGGDDQITVLRYLDPEVLRADPKPYFGYSDNTNLLNWLWFQGLASYHGGSTQVHLGRATGLHADSARSLRAALFESVDLELSAAETIFEDEGDWAATDFDDIAPMPSAGGAWTWHNADRVITAPTWGGNLEILDWTLGVSRYVHEPAYYRGCVLLLETSEEMPGAEQVFRMLRTMGERGLLEQFPAVVFGRAKAAHFRPDRTAAERADYRAGVREAVLRAFDTYHPDAMIVFDVDLGHTDPQWVLPYGGRMTIDGPSRRIVAHY